MIKMLQYKLYPAGELAVLRQLLFLDAGDAFASGEAGRLGMILAVLQI